MSELTGSIALWNLFRQGAAVNPRGTAVSCLSGDLSYVELRQRAETLADQLEARTGGTLPTVLLRMERELGLYIAYLAAARTGATIVPIDAATPPSRVADISAALGWAVLLTDSENLESIPRRWPVAFLSSQDGTMQRFRPGDTAEQDIAASMPAYIMFTSGSTGTPKGVPVEGTAVESYVESLGPLISIGPGDRHSQSFSIAFDLSVHDLFVTWASGATLVPPQKRGHALMETYVRELALTHWFSVPSSIELAIRSGPATTPTDVLTWAGFCGEPLHYRQVAYIRKRFPSAEILNLYGPTELTIACSAYVLPRSERDDIVTANGTVPIGLPFPGFDWHLRPFQGEPGDPSELVMRGPQRFRGYLDPSRNDGAFFPDADLSTPSIPGELYYRTGDIVDIDASGVLVHRGRIDGQVKIGGFRVELGEVESALICLGDMSSVVALANTSRGGGLSLAAFYVGKWEPSRAKARLREIIPSYMIPRQLVQLDVFPLNANGKLDRNALRRMIDPDVAECEETSSDPPTPN